MKILFLLQELPYPPATGITWKVFNILKYMSAKGHSCDVISFGDDPDGGRISGLQEHIPGINVLAVFPLPGRFVRLLKKLVSFFCGLPPSVGEFSNCRFRRTLSRLAASTHYDLVHYDVINMAQYLPHLSKFPALLSSNDAISLSYERMLLEPAGIWRRLRLFLTSFLIRRYERKAYPEFDAVHVVSAEDSAHLRAISSAIRTEIIPVSVADAYFDHVKKVPAAVGTPIQVVFTGNLDIPGIRNGLFDFLTKSYPAVMTGFTGWELRILGPKASAETERAISRIGGIKYSRWVDDYAEFLNSADIVLVLDKTGTGIKTRVLDAMALGKPVIASRLAMNGINARNDVDCLVQDSPSELTAALLRLLREAELRERIGTAAKGLISREYLAGVVGPKWEELYQRIAAVRSAGEAA